MLFTCSCFPINLICMIEDHVIHCACTLYLNGSSVRRYSVTTLIKDIIKTCCKHKNIHTQTNTVHLKTQACERVTSKQCCSLHFLNSSRYSGHGAIKKCQSRCAERRAMGQPQGFLAWFPLAQLNIDESEVLLTR